MHVRITQIDGTLPNLALMRLAAHHRARGDEIHFTRRVRRELFEPAYGAVYGSAIFKFSADRVERFKSEFPGAIVGGTGTDSGLTVEGLIGDGTELDYSLYPDFAASIGFTQRGCRVSCKFCVVPTKEGKPRPAATVGQIWLGGSAPKNLHLLDNDFFGQPDWQGRIAEIRDGGFKVCFSQGINVRAMTAEVAAALASIEYRCTDFRRRRLYTAWDNLKDEETFFRGVDLLEAHGVPDRHLMAYMLIGFDKRETWERIHHRFERMVARGIRPYPMPFDQSRRDLKRFQRWAVLGHYRDDLFSEYDPNIASTRSAALRRLAHEPVQALGASMTVTYQCGPLEMDTS
ncbi:hypothetical protein [Bradyrhizobium sp. USDA 4503]